jgi:hypothetical protein
VYRARLAGGAANEALTAYACTSASSDGLSVITTEFDVNSPSLVDGTVWGYDGPNAGIARKITAVGSNDATVTVAFPRDIVVGDNFLYAPIYPTGPVLIEFGTDLTNINAAVAIAGNATVITVEMVLNDESMEGTTQSYALIQFADSLFSGAIT